MEHKETEDKTTVTEHVDTLEPTPRKPLAKKQHYVPQFYLKRFADQNGKWSVLDIPEEAIHAGVPYRDHCYKTYFYGRDGKLETSLSSMESQWSAATNRLISRKPITPDDANLVKQFAIYQIGRTLAQAEFLKRQDAAILKDVVEMRLRNQSHNQRLYTHAEIARACSEKIERETAPGHGINLLKDLEPFIDDLELAVIRYETVNELLSSDVPVVAINRFFEPSIGLSCMGLILFFPLDPHHLAVIYDGTMYSAYKGKSYVASEDEKEVEDINVFQYISAETIVFAQRQETLVGLNFTDPKMKQERDRSRDIPPISTFGPENGEHIIQVSLRKTYHECDLSFARLPIQARKIPVEFREAVPRTKDEKWSEKLSRKESILAPSPQVDVPSPRCSTSERKRLRRGYQSMSRFAELYWHGQL